jgi:cysteine desulfurase/selenocysteine lyase
MLDVAKIREEFPALHQKVHDHPLAYLDNAATTQKPRQVIEALTRVYAHQNSNIHRGVHYLSNQMTEAYERARSNVRSFLNAEKDHEIIFTSGTTGSINLLAHSFGEAFIGPGDEILITGMEHHSNIVPWQMLAERKEARLKVIPINDRGELKMESTDSLFTPRTRLLALSQVSNTLGTINPVKELVDKAHALDIPVLVDGAQAVQHGPVDVQALGCDFYAFSGHKAYGPNGIGILYGRESWLEKLPAYQGGGDMVARVTFEKTSFAELPLKFEAGTANYPAAIGLSEALNFLGRVGWEDIGAYENELKEYASSRLQSLDGMRIFGTSDHKICVFSFLLNGIHASDAGLVLDKMGIAVRTGHHCAEPVMDFYGVSGMIRASFSFYNTMDEVDRLIEGLEKVQQMFL